ncbi:hypothetical protein AAVH_16342 [Aphelenchoides avenae]|nr:hypothetical protein AAVH_16342 [Aphelenchus avenae]
MHGSRLALLEAQDLNVTAEVLEKLAKNKDRLNAIKLIAPTHFASSEVFQRAFTSLFTFESVHFCGNDRKANASLATKEFFELPSISSSSEISLSLLYTSHFSVPAAAAWLTSNLSDKQKLLSITADSQLYVQFAASLVETLQKDFTTSKQSAPFNLKIRFITDDDKESETKVYYNESTGEELVVSSFIENPDETPMYTQICVQRSLKGATRDAGPVTNSSVSMATLFGTFISLLLIGIVVFQAISTFMA